MELLSYILFSLALNLDSFGAGVTYGVRKIKIPPFSLVIISLISVAAISVSMLGGRIMLTLIPASLAHHIGSAILLLTGLWILHQSRRREHSISRMIEIHIRPLGLAIQILREPARADLDGSGVISPHEALFLGAALAMDALVAGFAVSMFGFDAGFTAAVVGVGYFALTYLGILAGRSCAIGRAGRQLTALPGLFFISLGLLKIY